MTKEDTFISCLVFLVLIDTPTSCATFENVEIILKWNSRMQDERRVRIRSDDSLKNYVGEFGEVQVHNQYIPQLEVLSVSNLPKVTHLHLTSCKIRRIKPGAFQNLPQLTDLNLSGNLLEEIENGVFDRLKFKTLYLENNRIAMIGDTAFNNLKMEYLFIDDNRISEWRSEWFQGTPLVSISMANNFLQRLPQLAFEYLWHFGKDIVLINFTVSSNGLTHIDPDAFEGVKTIISLNFQNNSLTYLEPGTFDSVELIDQIDLSSNKLFDIYYEVFRRTKVSQINVYDNLLTCISTDIFNGTEVRVVNVGRNPISCDCVKEWTKWMQTSKIPMISDVADLRKECTKSEGTTKSKSILLYILLFLYLIG